jgi:hypothetical protein
MAVSVIASGESSWRGHRLAGPGRVRRFHCLTDHSPIFGSHHGGEPVQPALTERAKKQNCGSTRRKHKNV